MRVLFTVLTTLLLSSPSFAVDDFFEGDSGSVFTKHISGGVSGFFDDCDTYGPNSRRALADHDRSLNNWKKICAYQGGRSEATEPVLTATRIRGGKADGLCKITASSTLNCI